MRKQRIYSLKSLERNQRWRLLGAVRLAELRVNDRITLGISKKHDEHTKFTIVRISKRKNFMVRSDSGLNELSLPPTRMVFKI